MTNIVLGALYGLPKRQGTISAQSQAAAMPERDYRVNLPSAKETYEKT